MKNNAIVLLSGGLDSFLCLLKAIKNPKINKVIAVSFDYGQNNNRELESARKIATDYKIDHCIQKLPVLDDFNPPNSLTGNLKNKEDYTVLNRNLTFLVNAATIGLTKNVSHLYLGVTNDGSFLYSDCREETIKVFEQALSLSIGKEIIIHTPLISLNKEEILQEIKDNKMLDYALLHTHSCFKNDKEQCGICLSCRLKKHALKYII